MSSRAEEKERRRQERMAAEQEAQRSAARRKRLGLVGGVVLVAAIAVVAVLAIASGGSGDDGTDPEGSGIASVAIPEQRIENLNEAVEASSCELQEHPIEGRDHTTETVEYDTNPPTSGAHDPTPAEDGIYAPGNPPDVEQSVHSLEHGRILFQYRPDAPEQLIGQLTSLFNESVKGTEGYHSLLFENQTNMEPQIAATAWGYSLTCAEVDDTAWDALRAFRRDRVDKGPEFIP